MGLKKQRHVTKHSHLLLMHIIMKIPNEFPTYKAPHHDKTTSVAHFVPVRARSQMIWHRMSNLWKRFSSIFMNFAKDEIIELDLQYYKDFSNGW